MEVFFLPGIGDTLLLRQIFLLPPVLHCPQKKSEKPIFRTIPRLEAPPPLIFLRTTFRNSAITLASPLIKCPPPCDRVSGALTAVWQNDSSFGVL